LWLAGPADPQAIIEGEPTTADPAVVALATYRVCQDTTEVYCTGTLVAPRVVLTAAHCVDQPVELVQVFFGDDTGEGGQWLRAAALRADPNFDPVTFANDIGAIILGEDAPVAPISINSEPLSQATVGLDARIVGFGLPEPGGGRIGVKRTGQTQVSVVESSTFETVPNPAMTCQVDSGGPVFLHDAQGAEVVAGITSSGDAFCETFAVNTRVDSYIAEFLTPVLAEAAAGELEPPPAPALENCPGCSVLGCGDGEVCDADSDSCMPAIEDDGGCSISNDNPLGLFSLISLMLLFARRRLWGSIKAE
jgi:hypothetical protein